MKRSVLYILAIVFAVSYPLALRAQGDLNPLIEGDDPSSAHDSVPPQRIGIPPGEAAEPRETPDGEASTQAEPMQLSSNETGVVEGYCFDEHLIAPRRLTRFQNVLAGGDVRVTLGDGRSMGLKEAIDGRLLEVSAQQLQVRFTNRSGGDMQIALNGPIVLWDRPGGYISPASLSALTTGTVGSTRNRQEAIWRVTTAERSMGVLGYYDGSHHQMDPVRFEKAIRDYQVANGLTPNGVMDPATTAHIANEGRALADQLRALGFRDSEGRSLKPDLAAQIRAYQRYTGQSPTGRWSPSLAQRFASDQKILPQISALRPAATVGETLKSGRSENVLTYLNGLKSFQTLVETPQGIELWGRRGSTIQFQARDRQAVQNMDDAAAAMAQRANAANRIVVYPRASSGDLAAILVGNRTINLDAQSLRRYLDGGTIPAELASALDPTVPRVVQETGGAGKASIVVYRGPFVQGRGGDAGAGTSALSRVGLVQTDGAVLAKALDRTYGDRAVVYVSNDLRVGATRLKPGTESQGSRFDGADRGSRFALAR